MSNKDIRAYTLKTFKLVYVHKWDYIVHVVSCFFPLRDPSASVHSDEPRYATEFSIGWIAIIIQPITLLTDSYFGFCSHKQCSNVCVYEHSCTYIWMYFCGVNSYLWNYMDIMWNLKSGEYFLITLQNLYSPQCMSILCTISSTLISRFKKFAGEKEGVLLLFCFLNHEWEKASFKILLGSCIFFFLIWVAGSYPLSSSLLGCIYS